MIPALLLALQAAQPWVIAPPAPTVGDTVAVERLVTLGADARLRAEPLASSLLLEPLGEPVVLRVDSGVRVRYTLALFEPGRHAVEMPPVEVLYRDGRVDQIPPDTAWITVAAVVPAGDSLPPPRGSLAPLARFPTRRLPLLLLTSLVLVGAGLWALVRRRRPPMPAPAPAAPGRAVAPLARWMAAGEARAVATLAADRLRACIAALEPRADRRLSAEECIARLDAVRPEWPVRTLAELLRGLERAQFAPAVASDVGALVAQVDELVADLGRGAGVASA